MGHRLKIQWLQYICPITARLSCRVFLTAALIGWIKRHSTLSHVPFLDVYPQGETATGAKQRGENITNRMCSISDLNDGFILTFTRRSNFFQFLITFPPYLRCKAVWGWMRCGLAAEQQRTSALRRSFPRDCRPFTGNADACTPTRRIRCKSQPLWSIGKTCEAWVYLCCCFWLVCTQQFYCF